jgi:DNA-binding CsgD family transcriptional regulator
METPPFAKLRDIRAERATLAAAFAAQDEKLAATEGRELRRLSRYYSDAEIGAAVGLTAQRVGQLRRRSAAKHDLRTDMERMMDSVDSVLGRRAARRMRART